ncbi:MAG: hypothetical protein IJA87_08410 [Clostridia bacterium]|nr:hypothetical protein [Clostridia bacterium]
MKAKGLFRFIAVLLLCIILLPIIFSVYVGISPGDPPQDIGNAIISTVPLGEQIWGTFLAASGQGSEGFESALGWFDNTDINAFEFIILESSQVFLISVIMIALESLLSIALSDIGRGFLNQVANILYKSMVVFGASLISQLVYDLFINEVSKLTGTSQNVMIYVVAILSIVGGIVALIVGKGFVKSALRCALKSAEIFVTYALCISMFLGTFPWIAIIIVWILVIWGFYFVEKLIK